MGSPTSTFGLLERVHRGDREAFTPLFEKYSRRLAVLIHCRMSPELHAAVEVDDLLQEVFLRAFRDLPAFEYRTPGSFMQWLASISRHVIIDQARYQGREQRAGETVRFRSESNPLGPDPADRRTPTRILHEREDLRILADQLGELPPDYREVILLAKVEELSTSEISERLGRSREAVAVLLHRAVKRFREIHPT